MIQISILLNETQFNTYSFSQDESTPKVKTQDILDLKDVNSNLIIYPKSLEKIQNVLEALQKENITTPIREESEINYTKEELKQFSFNDVKTKILSPIYTQFALHNNVLLLNNLFAHISKLQSLLFTDRLSFFEELWHLLRINSGSNNANLIYNGFVVKKTKKNEQSQEQELRGDLVQNMVIGEKFPQTKIKNQLATNIYGEYKIKVSSTLEIIEFDKNKGTFVLSGVINESPFLFVAKTFSISVLQEKIIKALIDGINFKLNK